MWVWKEGNKKTLRYSFYLFLQESYHILTLMNMFPQSTIGDIEIYGKYI